MESGAFNLFFTHPLSQHPVVTIISKRQHNTDDALSASHATDSRSRSTNTMAKQCQNDGNAALPKAKRPKLSAIICAGAKAVATKTTSALLKLPSELLNSIYEYVLTSEDDLLEHVVVPEASSSASPNDQTWSVPAAESPSTSEKSCRFTSSEQHGNGGPALEVSNRSNTLNNASDTIFAHYLQKDGSEFNQLKYVCKKLWRETCRIELKYNGVLFTDEAGVGVVQVEQFFAACAPSQRRWLKKVTILSGRDVDLEEHLFQTLETPVNFNLILFMPYQEYVRLDAFCFHHLWMSIEFVINPYRFVNGSHNRSQDEYGPIRSTPLVYGMIIHYALRNTIPLGLDFISPVAQTYLEMLGWPQDNARPLLQAPNLRIYPQNLVRGIGIGVLLEHFERYKTHGDDEKKLLALFHKSLTQGI
ncbi:uncharacterized protein N0V89_011212 [Didymosphaeria variabile]|uniref:Uncharacterized protein n=1 Tax=Didymosphaeria variabile TaxID=1932322 RepID=A0A9W9C7U6_9PLEO|nr:uncharacterized protein N0V89_011212 [Didymosphaeria variabile]KAJ4347272.1 hypothetical protein N0V89_011212 [Didymosphaeria variabile]